MMRAVELGGALFASSLAGLGLLSLLSGDFALNWQPVPAWVPWRPHLAHASGLVLFVAGSSMFVKRSTTLSALVLTINMFMWLLVLQVPRVVAHPANGTIWLGFSESLMLAAGGWILFASLAAPEYGIHLDRVAGDKSVHIARFFYALALPMVGLSHFVYIQATTALVPAWLPGRMFLAYLTGACHIAAGVGLLVTIVPRLAATLEALMISSFTLLVCVPRVVVAPLSRVAWTALLASSALSGAAWIVAHSLRGSSSGRRSLGRFTTSSTVFEKNEPSHSSSARVRGEIRGTISVSRNPMM